MRSSSAMTHVSKAVSPSAMPPARRGAPGALAATEARAAATPGPTIQLVPRQCALRPYHDVKVSPFKVSGQVIAYASPDSTYAVTSRLIEGAKKSILIGIYDFSADYVKEMLLRAMERGVRVSLMLDIDGEGEKALFKDLAKHGAECVPAPSCASTFVHYFASSHEKVIVIDDHWVLVQSGNYSNNSIPMNPGDGIVRGTFRSGNRDMGIAVESPQMARFFNSLLRSDMKLETDAEGRAPAAAGRTAFADTALLAATPSKTPQLFPSKAFHVSNLEMLPVLSPDTYMDVIPDLLASAKESICIEQQYIRPRQADIQVLLRAIQKNKNRPKVRVVLARPMSRGAQLTKEIADMRSLKQYGLAVGKNIRILNPSYFVHCHNKLLVVDGKRVLVSSQNWSDSAVSKNREAGLLLGHSGIAQYFQGIFEWDWSTALKAISAKAASDTFTTESLNAGRRLLRIDWGDYAEV